LVSCVKLVDLFEKNLSRSLTFRLHLQSKDRSIEKEDLEEVISVATKTLMIPGIKLRL
jgi:phenylalanyl-tRNA synthetase beta subunit